VTAGSTMIAALSVYMSEDLYVLVDCIAVNIRFLLTSFK
jgi:hypothetical protein